MCGINGIIGYEPLEGAEQQIRSMNSRLAHRGPDHSGVFCEGEVALGHQRLSIIDLSDSANQPMQSADGRYELVFNGELYNYKEVRQKLAGAYTFRTESDTEVLLAAFDRWGENCLHHFNGMFAFCIWDRQEKKATLARDRMGIKPLYWFATDKGLVFSSEIRALLASEWIKPQLDEHGLVDFLRYQTVHLPWTIIDKVDMLDAGYVLTVDVRSENYKMRSWWSLTTPSANPLPKSLDEAKADIRDLFYKAVERRLVADVPFGAFLSGGIDSSAVVGAMARVMDGPVKTFSVTFDEEEFSEAKYARIIADKFKTDHTEIRLKPDDFLDLLPEALSAMDHPSADGPNTYIVSKVTREAGVTMALSGLGGDELFAGYPIFMRSLELQKRRYLQSFPKFMRAFAGTGLKLAKPGVASDKIAALLELDYFDLPNTYPLGRQVFLDPMVYKLLNNKFLSPNTVNVIASQAIGFGSGGFDLPALSQVSVAELKTYLLNVLLRDTDQMSMAHALEVRVPFLDHELVEYVLRISDNWKYPHTPKQLLTDSLGDLLPREIIDRPKMGFVLPYAQWMRGPLKDFCAERMRNLADRPELNGKVVNSLWKRFLKQDSSITWSRIWGLVVLQNWLEQQGVNS